MGRLFGRRPDLTQAIAPAVQGHLTPGERVLAAVHVQRPGTTSAGTSAAVSGAVSGSVDLPPSFAGEEYDADGSWARTLTSMGVEPGIAGRAVWLTLVLTTTRLLLLRRSRLTGRLRELAGSWSLRDVERLDVPRRGNALTIHGGTTALELELPQAHRFLPDVYRELPSRFQEARSALD